MTQQWKKNNPHLDPGISSHHDEFKRWILITAGCCRHAFFVMQGYMSQRPGREGRVYWREGKAVLWNMYIFYILHFNARVAHHLKLYNLNCAILENELYYKNILLMHRDKHIKFKLEAISNLSFSNWHRREWTWKLGLSLKPIHFYICIIQ